MNELQLFNNKEVTMTSRELCDLINKFRLEEGNKVEKRPDVLLRDIRKELKILEQAGIGGTHNFVGAEYIDEQGKTRPCYKMNKAGIMQMLNKESPVVRYKTQQYIEALENRVTTLHQENMLQQQENILQQQQLQIQEQRKQIQEQQKQIDFIMSKVGIRSKEKYNYGAIIKRHLGIDRVNGDYKTIRDMFFHELGVTKWEDIPYSRENVTLLDDICKTYRPHKRFGLMAKVFGE